VNNIISISNLHKSYGKINAVNGLNLSIEKGEMFGLVGPDGAGKTTTIKILCGLLGYNKGKVSLLNKSILTEKNKIQESIGYLSQKFSLYRDLTVDENIEFFAEIHNVSDYKKRRDELLEFTRLTKFRTRLADNLSGGMKQKLALACSLIHKPEILFLDEPTTGVDPVSRRDFWKILSSLRNDGITILMTTPYLDEAERCSRVGMMNKGQIIALDKPENIKAGINKQVMEVVCTPIRKAYTIFKNNSDLDTQLFGDRINIVTNDVKKLENEINILFETNSIEIISKRVISPTLENVFMYKIKEAN
jgi:ABC-2 type transport system ATP-binding protein